MTIPNFIYVETNDDETEITGQCGTYHFEHCIGYMRPVEPPEFDVYGRRYYHTLDSSEPGRKAVSLSKNGLGVFSYHLFKLGGSIESTYVMNYKYDRSFIQMSVLLRPDCVDDFEKASGFGLTLPREVKLNAN